MMRFKNARLRAGVFVSILCCAVGSLLSGCAFIIPQTEEMRQHHPEGIAQKKEIDDVPFFPQKDYQCGPAALATSLAYFGAPVTADVQVLLLDAVGELLAFYGAADVAFVGGSLVDIGGHNLLEPAALKLPVLTGPSDFNAKEIAAMLLQTGAARRVADAAQLGAAVSELLGDSRERQRIGAIARRAVETNRGSAQRLLKLVEAQCASVLAAGSRAPPKSASATTSAASPSPQEPLPP